MNSSNISIKKNTVLNIIKTCSSILFPVITLPYITRILQPENIGKVQFAQSFINYFIIIASLGITTYAIRECAAVKDNREELSNISSQLFSINIIMTVIAYLILFITLIYRKNLNNYRSLILIESITIIFYTLGADWLNTALEDFKYITIRSLLFQLVSLISIFIFVKEENDYIIYAIICVISSTGANILNIFYRRRFCNMSFTFNIEWKKHLTPVFFLFIMMLSQTIFNNADITILGLIKTDYEVGLYSTANKVMRLIAQVIQSLGLVIIPRLSVYYANEDFESINKLLRKVLSFNITLGLPCVTGIIMLADEVIYAVGGIEYANSASILRILIISFMFSIVGGNFLGNAILLPLKKEKYYMWVCLITSILNICFNFLLIPKYGAYGAAISSALNGFIIFILLLLKLDNRIHIENLWKIFISPLIGCLDIILCCWLCSFIINVWIRFFASVVLSAFTYAILLIFIKNELALEVYYIIKTKIGFRRIK